MMDSKLAKDYIRLKSFQRKLTNSQKLIVDALQSCERPYVACSFGKDSAAMLHMVIQYAPDIEVRFVRWKGETDLIDNYDEVINEWQPLNLIQVELNRDSVDDKVKDRYNTTGYDTYFIGLRADESKGRRITLRMHGTNYKMKSGMTRIAPVAWWSTNDVAAYVMANDIPTLNSYKVNGFEARTVSRVPREAHSIRQNFLIDLKHRNQNAYLQLLNKFPELALY